MKDTMPFDLSAEDWLAAHPDVTSLRVAVCDQNGCLRGKRLPRDQIAKAFSGAIRMPLSLSAQDIWGRDVEDNPMVSEGDADGLAHPTGRSPLLMDWLAEPTALLPLWFFNEDGTPSDADPRQALAAIVARYAALGLTPVVATELEFYLVNSSGARPAPPVSPITGKPLHADGVLSLDDVDHFDAFFADVYRGCKRADIPLDTAIAEGGAGQFEINFHHVSDPLKAADDALFFKRLVKGIARRHFLTATFMAKPFPERSGNGFHVHFSLCDRNGDNLFDDGTARGSDTMRHAVGGLLEAMEGSTLIFAPHLNSYRRLAPNAHAPTVISWAHDNRFAAIRIPGGPREARRIEHRVAGADANPYMVLAAILGAALRGIENRIEPPPPVTGDVYESDAPELPGSWERAIDEFGGGGVSEFLPETLVTLFRDCKRQEWVRFMDEMSEFELATYLEVV